MLISEFLNDNN